MSQVRAGGACNECLIVIDTFEGGDRLDAMQTKKRVRLATPYG
jgi:hypothetical protein